VKRTAVLLLVVLIISLLVAVPISAEGEVFVAAGNTVLPLTDAMPIRSGGAWYIDYQCFTEGTLSLNASYNATERKLVLYNWDTTLIFDLNTATAYTVHDNVQYKAVAIASSGTVYVPVQFTAQILGFDYGYYPEIPLIRVMRPNDIPYSMFQYIAKNAIPGLLADYNAKKEAEKVQNPPPSDTEDKNRNKTLRLTVNIRDGERFDDILSSLYSNGFRATFFIDEAAIPKCENEIRRAIIQGHKIGIYATSPDGLDAANEKLFDVAKTKTRLVRFANGSSALSEEDVEKVISQGYRLWDSNISPNEASSSRIYSTVTSQLKSASRSTVVSLSDSQTGVTALGRILRFLKSERYVAYTISLLDTPVNQISERR